MSIALHKLTDSAKQIKELMEIDPETWESSLADIEGMVEDKVRACGYVYRNLLAESELLKAASEIHFKEANRVKDDATALENKAERLRRYCEVSMLDMEMEEVKADTFKIKFHKLPPSVEIPDEKLVPDEWRAAPKPTAPRKKDILSAMKDGQKFEWAVLVTDRRKLVVK